MVTAKSLEPIPYGLFESKQRKGDLKKLEIIKAAIECLSHEDPESMTYDAIAKKLNTNRAHIAYYFSDKSEIYLYAVKYILSIAQQLTIEQVAKAKSGREMLTNYIDSYFAWAKKYPEQLTVMLLFYYLCPLKKEYKDLHSEIRKAGLERLVYILTTSLEQRLSHDTAVKVARDIQALLSGSMIDAYTTHDKSMKQAKQNVSDRMWQIIEFELK